MKKILISIMTLLLMSGTAYAKMPPEAENNTPMAIIEKSAKALGGIDRIRNLHTLNLQGYAQYAYMWGGGNITASPDAPQKWMAANDLQRNWDFDNDRFQLKERVNMLFPFAAMFGHAFFPNNHILDKNIAYDKLPDGNSLRVGNFTENPLFIDGSRVRKLWSLTNPIALFNAILNNKAKVDHLRKVNNLDVMDVIVDKDVSIVLAINHDSKIPEYVQWYAPQSNLGEVTFTTTFTGYMPFDGILLPMGYNTKINFRDIVYFKMYVDGYRINKPVENMSAPTEVVQTKEPINEASPIEVETIDKGVWRLTGGTTVIEFENHLTLFELYGNEVMGKAIIEKANTLVPNKKVTELIVSHHHFDHTGGFRAAVAAGLTVYSNRANEVILREVAERPTPHFKDVLESNRQFKFIPIDEHLRLSDSKATVDIYHVISNNHMADGVFAYIPDKKILMDADIGTAAADWQLWPNSYLDNLDYYGIKVDKIISVHEKTMTHKELLQFIEEGRQRAIQRDVQYKKMNEYLPGYPIFETR